MDALEIMSNPDYVTAYFQPIFSADEHRIVGYEILGRYIEENTVASLGAFFHDEEIPDEYKIEIDELVTKFALHEIITSASHDALIFINRDAKHLLSDDGESFLKMLKNYEKMGLELNRIVLEISEEGLTENFADIVRLLQYYKTYGIKIAIDNVKGQNTSWDQISDFAPDILKVDLQKLRHDVANQSFKDMLYSLSLLARKIGATLLFQNIEMDYQLHFAWRNGGRYYQGIYLEEPKPDLLDPDILREKLKEKCQNYIKYEKRHLEIVYSLADILQADLVQSINKTKKAEEEDYNTFLFELTKQLGNKYFRVYICDENGFQLTCNVFRNEQTWEIQKEYVGKNWSWRPYFLENIIKMRNDKKGLLSDIYSDLETGQLIRTFSYPLGQRHFLFMDLSYEFLYEQDGLLY